VSASLTPPTVPPPCGDGAPDDQSDVEEGTGMTGAPAIELEGVSFAYDGTPVVEDATFALGARDFVSIVGPNGGGKTTLLKLVLGLLRPTAGRVRIFGTTPHKARTRIGYLPQHATLDPLFPVSVLDVVLMGRLGRAHPIGRFGRGDRGKALAALDEVSVADLRARSFAALSGGQRQRVLIARALASEPDLLLLDEPTASLDAAVEEEFYELLRRLNEHLGVVLVSHDLGFVSHYVRRVVCVKRRVAVHPTSEVTGEMIREVYGMDVRMVRHDHGPAGEALR
jgi:zinc transport system ATP-binding protein